MKYDNIKLEEIEKELDKLFLPLEENKELHTGIAEYKELEEFFNGLGSGFAKHQVWKENDTVFSSWTFKSPGGDNSRALTINTGDGGAEMMKKAFLDNLRK